MRVHKPKNKSDDEIHQGRNIKNVREMLGWKQGVLAQALGPGWSQKRVSLLENKEEVRPGELREIAKILEVPEDLFRTATKAKLWRLLQHNLNEDSAYDRQEETMPDPGYHAIYKLNHIANALVECQRQLLSVYDKQHDAIRPAEGVLAKAQDANHFIRPPSRGTGS